MGRVRKRRRQRRWRQQTSSFGVSWASSSGQEGLLWCSNLEGRREREGEGGREREGRREGAIKEEEEERERGGGGKEGRMEETSNTYLIGPA